MEMRSGNALAWYYTFSKRIHRNIPYGEGLRNKLDLYLPENIEDSKPVVAFVTGGAWVIGNYPQATISDMIKDASKGISYICNNASKYGGDPNKYNLAKEADHIETQGYFRPLFERIMEGEESFVRFSPELVVQSPSFNGPAAVLPPFYLFHGTADYSIPCASSTSFMDALLSVGVEAKTILYPEKTHTDLFLQDPMRGGHNDLIADMLAVIHAGDPEAESKDVVALPRRRMVPEVFLQLARRISPF